MPPFVRLGLGYIFIIPHCLTKGEHFKSVRIVFTLSNLSGAPTIYGDINADGIVNASDAACILQYAAAVGAGYTGTLEEYMAK
jgi:hypothetical protein